MTNMTQYTGKGIAILHRLYRQGELLREPKVREQVSAIWQALGRGDNEYAQQLYSEFDWDEKVGLWVAPKFGGCWTTAEREILKYGRPTRQA